MAKSDFRQRVFTVVRLVPKGRVMTYGQVALLCGLPRAAQAVGWSLHTAPDSVPYQRIVNRFGRLAGGYPDGGPVRHRAELEDEGVEVREDDTVDLAKYQWWPDNHQIKQLRLPADAILRIAELIDNSNENVSISRRKSVE